MGNWAMVVTGTGAHHNKDYEGDADKLFRKFLEELKASGQRALRGR